MISVRLPILGRAGWGRHMRKSTGGIRRRGQKLFDGQMVKPLSWIIKLCKCCFFWMILSPDYVSDKSVVWRILISAICNLPHSSLISFQVQICVETSVYKFWEKNIVRCATPSAGERLSESMQYPCTTSHWSSGRSQWWHCEDLSKGSYEAKWISETQWDYDLVMGKVLAITTYWHGGSSCLIL